MDIYILFIILKLYWKYQKRPDLGNSSQYSENETNGVVYEYIIVIFYFVPA